MGEHDEQFVFEMGYNKGFKDGIKGSTPKAEVKKFLEEGTKDVSNKVLAIVREDYIHKSVYEARLKADLAAILTDMRLEFEEELNCGAYCDECQRSCEDIPARWFLDFIQKKIDALKAESEDKE